MNKPANNILLATGLSQTEIEAEAELRKRGHNCWRCYHRRSVTEVAEKRDAEVVVLGPCLDGQEDLFETVIVPLWKVGTRIVFLPGAVEMPDTKEWVKKLYDLGVYCYVYDMVTAKKIIEKIYSPGVPGSVVSDIKKATDKNMMKQIDDAFDEPEPSKENTKQGLLQRVLAKKDNESPKAEQKPSVRKEQNKEKKPAIRLSHPVRQAEFYKGVTSTSDIAYLEQEAKGLKQPCVLIDADHEETNLSKYYGVDLNAWESDWRLGMGAKPFKLSKRISLFTIKPDQDIDERDIRAMKDIIDASVAQDIKVMLYCTDTKIIRMLKQKIEEAS